MLTEGLRAWRAERGLTQEELAQKANVSPTLIALIETGNRQPSLSTATAIADAIGVPLEAFALILAGEDAA